MVKRYRWLAFLLFVTGLFILCLFLNCGKGSARTITVDVDDDANFTKIQDAINVSKDGDIIRVYAGIYYENVVVNKSISLVGNGSEETSSEYLMGYTMKMSLSTSQ